MRSRLAFWLNKGRVLAAMNANIWDQGDALDTPPAIRGHTHPERLADPAVNPADLVPSGT